MGGLIGVGGAWPSLTVSEAGGDTPIRCGGALPAALLTTSTRRAGSWASSGGTRRGSSLRGGAGGGGEHRWLRTDEHRGGENNVKNTSDDNQCKGPELTVKDTDRPETNGRPRGVLFT